MSNNIHHTKDTLLTSLRVVKYRYREPDCPDEERLRLLAVGLEEPSTTQQLLDHAAGCDWCGTILREAIQDLAIQPTQEEIAFAAVSSLANQRRRRAFAARLADSALPTRACVERLRPPSARWIASACIAAGAVLFVAMPWFGEAATTQRLLAEAYHEERTSEMRLAGAAFTTVSRQRGSGPPASFPPSLLKAEARLAADLKARPDEPELLCLWGQAEMMAGRAHDAVAALEKARAARPHDPRILGDLGAAYALRAEGEPHPPEYFPALECFNRSLSIRPGVPEVMFNRALVLEKAQRPDQAMKAWEEYLRVDPRGEWATEARRRLSELQLKLKTDLRTSFVQAHELQSKYRCVAWVTA